MEIRDDLATLLLNGLPVDERAETLRSISRVDRAKLIRLRAQGAAEEFRAPSRQDLFELDEEQTAS